MVLSEHEQSLLGSWHALYEKSVKSSGWQLSEKAMALAESDRLLRKLRGEEEEEGAGRKPDAYRTREITRVLDEGSGAEDRSFRFKVLEDGGAETRWLNVSADELRRMLATLDGI